VNCAVAIQIELKGKNAELPPARRMEYQVVKSGAPKSISTQMPCSQAVALATKSSGAQKKSLDYKRFMVQRY